MKKMLLAAALLAAGTLAAHADPFQTVSTAKGDVIAGDNGMTLYTFKKDGEGMSNCYDACADNWPPYIAEAGAKPMDGYSLVERKDGGMMWAYDGKPLYYFKGDAKKGDMAGDGVGGAWHTVPQ